MKKAKKWAFRTSALALALVLIFFLLPTSAFAESAGVVTGNSVNVRSGPSTKHSTLGIQLHCDPSVAEYQA